ALLRDRDFRGGPASILDFPNHDPIRLHRKSDPAQEAVADISRRLVFLRGRRLVKSPSKVPGEEVNDRRFPGTVRPRNNGYVWVNLQFDGCELLPLAKP